MIDPFSEEPTTRTLAAPPVLSSGAKAPPPGLSPRAYQRWVIEQQIASCREALAVADRKVGANDTAALSRIGPLNTQLREWLIELAKLDAASGRDDPDAERRRWRAAATRVLDRIRTGLAARVLPE